MQMNSGHLDPLSILEADQLRRTAGGDSRQLTMNFLALSGAPHHCRQNGFIFNAPPRVCGPVRDDAALNAPTASGAASSDTAAPALESLGHGVGWEVGSTSPGASRSGSWAREAPRRGTAAAASRGGGGGRHSCRVWGTEHQRSGPPYPAGLHSPRPVQTQRTHWRGRERKWWAARCDAGGCECCSVCRQQGTASTQC